MYGEVLYHEVMHESTKPVILVRCVADLIDYYIQQGNHFINFRLDRASHEALKQAQAKSDLESEKQEHPPVSLRVIGSD